ncbi:MAG: hypothetical protein KF802_08180 [Bdellovibrionaceae bacterium]|nr:hypothetical protein [Pseudobdellovibrionaceae bacterium]
MKVETMLLLMEHAMMRMQFKVFRGYQRKIREKTNYDLKADFTGLESAIGACEQFLNISEELIIAEDSK